MIGYEELSLFICYIWYRDLLVRFIDEIDLLSLPADYVNDIVYIVQQEAEHFLAWKGRLDSLELPFGCFPFSDGLWQSATDTSGDILSRLAVINLTHEAKGLDSYYKTKEKFIQAHDEESLCILEKNFNEEIGHVALGLKWFKFICMRRALDAKAEFQQQFNIHFKGRLKGPFNTEARDKAGLTPDWYLPLTAESEISLKQGNLCN